MAFSPQGNFMPQPIGNLGPARPNISPMIPTNNQQSSPAPVAAPAQPVQQPTQQVQQAPTWQNNNQGGPPPWQQQQQLYQQPQGQFGIAQGQQVQSPNQSMEQATNNNSPQSVQNLLKAANQPGISNQNSYMNGAGQQGASAQAGFNGFQTNGMAATPNSGPYGGGYGGGQQGYQANQSGMNQMNYQGNQAQQGQYGQMGAPSYSGGQVQSQGMNSYPQFQNQTNPVPPMLPPPPPPPPPALPSPLPPAQTSTSQMVRPTSQMISISDVLAKDKVLPAQNELEDFLKALGVYSYEYKDSANGEGRRISPMAQEIEKTDLGKIAISTGSDGMKRVDYGKLLGTQLSATAMLNNKVNDLAKKLNDTILGNVKNKVKK
jgi:hypothetical protein